MTEYIPYTYLIGWTKLNLWYYGSRYTNHTPLRSLKSYIANPQDLWSTYFTSSRYVNSTRKKYGEPDVIQIRRTFKTASEAREWEAKVCRRMNVRYDPRFINKHNGDGKFYCGGHTEDTKNKISLAGRGRKITPEQSKQRSEARKGRKFSLQARENMSKAMKGRLGYNKGVRTAHLNVNINFYNIETKECVLVTNLPTFCEERNLSLELMVKVMKNSVLVHRNWALTPVIEYKKHSKENKERQRNRLSKTWFYLKNNEKVEIFNLRNFCKNNNLSNKSMRKVFYGEQKEYKGYTKYCQAL